MDVIRYWLRDNSDSTQQRRRSVEEEERAREARIKVMIEAAACKIIAMLKRAKATKITRELRRERDACRYLQLYRNMFSFTHLS